jgi:chromosome segregation ATPase
MNDFKQNLTYKEQECFAYSSGDTTSADMFDKLAEQEDMEDQLKEAEDNTWSAESALDSIEEELKSYKKAMESLKEMYYELPKAAQEILYKFDD